MTYTAKQYLKMTGYEPEQDDLDRLNCDKAGDLGHRYCGYCEKHCKPRFVCACYLNNRTLQEELI